MNVRSIWRGLLRRPQTPLPGFDRQYYLEQNADVRHAGIDAFEHFMEHGWKERRNPSSGFSISEYLDANPDVREEGVNPLAHYVEIGLSEGRRLRPSGDQPEFVPGPAIESPGNDDRIELFHRAPQDRRGRLV